MTPRSTIRLLAASITAITMLLAGLAGAVTAAQEDATVLLRAFACPDAAPSDPFSDCEHMIGATFSIDANGTTTEATTVADVGIGPGATLTVPAGADLTITLLSGAPDGYVPAPGFDPFSANVDDLPQVGFGGESTGPGVNFIAVPSDTSGGDDDGGDDSADESDEDTSGTTTLPETGTGTMAGTGVPAAPIGLLMMAILLACAGGVANRRRAG